MLLLRLRLIVCWWLSLSTLSLLSHQLVPNYFIETSRKWLWHYRHVKQSLEIINKVIYNSVQVTFTSLDLILHTEALLSAISFLSAALSSGSVSSLERETRTNTEDKMMSTKSSQYNTHNKLKFLPRISVVKTCDVVFPVSFSGAACW